MARRANPVAEDTTRGLIEAINQSPVPVPQPGDLFGGILFTIVGPVLAAALLVFLLFIIKPEAVLTKDQMEDYTNAELEIEKRNRGVVEPARQSRGTRRRQRRKGNVDA